jgi:hypothetical protein
MQRPDRNDPCYCGSGRKYKRCCLDADVARDRIERRRSKVLPADPALIAEVLPMLQAPDGRSVRATAPLLRQVRRVHQLRHPTMWQGQKVWGWAAACTSTVSRRSNDQNLWMVLGGVT